MSTIRKSTRGAWVIAHALKLQQVDAGGQFTNIETAGKFGRLLSVLSGSEDQIVSKVTLSALAKANHINHLELPTLLKAMEERHLVSVSKSGDVAILGVAHSTVLERTAEFFDGHTLEPEERVAIDVAELVSEAPVRSGDMVEYVSDSFRVRKDRAGDILELVEAVGFVDAEILDLPAKDKLYFNGNIFRGGNATKTYRVLQSLSSEEQRKVQELQQTLSELGYSTVGRAKAVLGEKLFEKLQAIALFDVNRVANSREEMLYVTRPASFAKYGNPWEEDTLDYAKALVSSFAYGMTRSSAMRGRITMLRLLLGKLIRGEWLNENTAAGEDYRYLELHRVVETKPGTRAGCYSMRLLKREVGEIALEVLTQGANSSESVLEHLPGSAVNAYTGPEQNRTVARKKTVAPSDRKVADLLQAIRTGRMR